MAEGKDLFQVEIITPDRIFFAGEADMSTRHTCLDWFSINTYQIRIYQKCMIC